MRLADLVVDAKAEMLNAPDAVYAAPCVIDVNLLAHQPPDQRLAFVKSELLALTEAMDGSVDDFDCPIVKLCGGLRASAATERDQAVRLANEILQPNSDAEWAAPLAREYLKEIAEEKAEPKPQEGADG